MTPRISIYGCVHVVPTMTAAIITCERFDVTLGADSQSGRAVHQRPPMAILCSRCDRRFRSTLKGRRSYFGFRFGLLRGAGDFQSVVLRRMKASNMGTVNAVSPCEGL